MTEIVLALALIALAGGTLLVWPSRWNIPVFLDLAFTVPAYVVPLFLTDAAEQFGRGALSDLTAITALGAGAYLCGIFIGFALPRFRATGLRFAFACMREDRFLRFVRKGTTMMLLLAVLGLYASFAIMGYIPMFASNPLDAKYFHGAYRAGYLRASVLFRLSFWTVSTLIPVAAAIWYESRAARTLALLAVGCAGIAMALSRGPVGFQMMLALGLFAAKNGRLVMALFALGVVLITCFGSAANYVLALLGIPLMRLSTLGPLDLWSVIAGGTPDIHDALWFLSGFRAHPRFTYGRTLVGGLVPYQYKWNPGLWSLSIASGSDRPGELTNGGLRLPMPVWGYAAYGWPGVVLVSAISGAIAGYAARFGRRYVGKGSLVRSAVALALYSAVVESGYRFPVLQTHYFPPILITLLLAYDVGVRRSALTEESPIARPFLSLGRT